MARPAGRAPFAAVLAGVLVEVLHAHQLFDKITQTGYTYQPEEEVILCKANQPTKHIIY